MIASIGEILVDMIALEEKPLAMVKRFEKHPGGAPANVAVGLSRLNIESALISKVGNDPFGEFLIKALREEGVIPLISKDDSKHTGIVFVQLIGARPEFILYDGVAYFNLRQADIPIETVRNVEILHFGTVLFAREPSRSTVFEILTRAKDRVVLSYDVNIRLDLWRGREEDMLRDVKKALELADIVKLGLEEYTYLTERGVSVEKFKPKLIAITLGSKGSLLISGKTRVEIPAIKIKAIDTTGAGDAFMAGLLAGLHYAGAINMGKYDEELLEKLGRFANLIAGKSVTKRGAWSTPMFEEIMTSKEFLSLRG